MEQSSRYLTIQQLEEIFRDMEEYSSYSDDQKNLIMTSVHYHISEGDTTMIHLLGGSQVGPTGGPYIHNEQ